MIRLFARHTGRHVQGAALPSYCPPCLAGRHRVYCEAGACQCACRKPLAIEAPRRERPSWWERFTDGASSVLGACDRGFTLLGRAWDYLTEDDPKGVMPPEPRDGLPVAHIGVPRPGLAESRVAVAGPGHTQCPNCGRPGYEDGVCPRCGWGYGYQPAYEAAVAAIYAPGQLPVTPQNRDDTDIFSLPRVSARREARRAMWMPPRPEDTWVQRTVAALMAEYFPPPLKAIEA